jgi:hypothetical protein
MVGPYSPILWIRPEHWMRVNYSRHPPIRGHLRTTQYPISNTDYFSKLVRLPTIPYFYPTGKAAFEAFEYTPDRCTGKGYTGSQ